MTLTDVLSRARCLLVDFDGPICAVFAGYPAATIAAEMRSLVYASVQGDRPPAIAELASDPYEILVQVSEVGDDRLSRIAGDACRDAEIAAVASATPTPGAADVLRAAHDGGMRVAIVSNNAGEAIEAYLHSHDLLRYVGAIVGRFDGMDPHRLKPDPFLVTSGLSVSQVQQDQAAFIGDSITDVEAGRAAGVLTIGYANKRGKHQRLTTAGADVVTESMPEIAQALNAVTTPPAR